METRKIVSLPADLARAIEDFRFANRMKTEAEAIRRLIELGLTGAAGTAQPGGSDPGSDGKPDGTGERAAPRATQPAVPDREAKPAPPRSKEAQLRALRERSA
jgi:hypothetical protein